MTTTTKPKPDRPAPPDVCSTCGQQMAYVSAEEDAIGWAHWLCLADGEVRDYATAA